VTVALEPQIRTRLEESIRRGAADFEGAATRVADRQLVRLREESQVLAREASSQLAAATAKVNSLLQSAAGATLEEFRRQAAARMDQALSEANQRVTASLASLDAETRTACEARRRAIEDDLARATEHSAEQFRKAIKAVLGTCLAAAVGTVDARTQAALDALVENDGKVSGEATGHPRSTEKS
jgi:hypothetical protein